MPFNTLLYVNYTDYVRNNRTYTNTAQQSKAGHSCPIGMSLWHDSDEIGVSTMCVDHWSLQGVNICINEVFWPVAYYLMGSKYWF